MSLTVNHDIQYSVVHVILLFIVYRANCYSLILKSKLILSKDDIFILSKGQTCKEQSNTFLDLMPLKER